MGRVPGQDPRAPKSPFRKGFFWLAGQRATGWIPIEIGNRVDPFLMKMSGGRLKLSAAFPTVLLTHKGAKSGKKRTTPLAYFTDGGNVVLIASRSGADRHPAWYHNVLANPDVELWANGQGGRYRAREAQGELRERLWQEAVGFYPGFGKYQERAGDRRIPVVVCSPQDE
jgi:deazaflavin-dependent oxidoreductase (nitroreductase family)